MKTKWLSFVPAILLLLLCLPVTAFAVSSTSQQLAVVGSPGWDIYSGATIGGYRYGPSFIVNSDGSIDMWACSEGGSPLPYDYIRYQRSTDGGATWGSDQIVLPPTAGSMDALSTCDPGVIKFGGYYYIAYTSTTNRGGTNNQIFVARSTSPTGTWEKWNGTGWGGNPQPFIVYDGSPLVYGAGQPSFVVKGSTLYIYYSWTDNNMNQMRVATASTANANWPGSLTYHGAGINKSSFEDATDVKYVEALDKFIGVQTNNWGSDVSYVEVYSSSNGFDFTKEYYMDGDHYARASNAGLSGDALGHIKATDSPFLSYAYGSFGATLNWNTRLTPITMSLKPSGAFSDNFSSGAGKWTPYQGSWSVAGGAYTQTSLTADTAYAGASGTVFGNAVYDADLRITSAADPGEWAGLHIGKIKENDNFTQSGYLVFMRANGNMALFKAGTGQVTGETASGLDPTAGTVHLKVVKSGGNIKVFTNGSASPLINWTDNGLYYDSGYFGVVTRLAGATFDNVTALNNFSDDFASGAGNWTANSGTWAVSGGTYNQTNAAADPGSSTLNNLVLGNGVIEADVKINAGSSGNWTGLSFAKTLPTDAYYGSGYLVLLESSGNVSLYKGGTENKVVVKPVTTGANPTTGFVHIKIMKHGGNIQVFVGNVASPQIDWNDPNTVFGSGYVSLTNVKSSVSFDNIAWTTQKVPGGSTNLGASNIPNLARFKTVSSNDSLVIADWDVSRLTDGIETPVFGSAGYTTSAYSAANISATPVWVDVDLGSNQTVDKVKLFPRLFTDAVGGGSPNFPVDFTIQTAPDGGSYGTVATITNQGNPVGFPQEYNFTPVNARHVRILVTKLGTPTVDDPGSYRLQLSEIEIYHYQLS
ncbi:discoidin domain-containing protein [Cohnella sp. GCM10020058]|uniref:galactose-binding domain-containing protein n=1 Tax=Cohnella sp. GCM10020058 TaxID=3317330 RepID=UPI003640EC00